MKQFWSGVMAATFAATVGLAAQNNPSSTSAAPQGGAGDRPAPSAQASTTGKSITVSGCIQNAPAATATAGAAGATASATAGSKFVLANAKMAAAGAPGSAVGTSGSAMRYQLQGDEKSISPHVNHQVEITGTLESGAGAGAAAGQAPAAGAGQAAGAAAQTLKVESVKMVSATCS